MVTGGAGYLGSVLTPLLLREGFRVTVVDNLMYKQVTLLDCFSDENFSFIKGDATDERIMLPLLEKADVVIPLAALVGASACHLNPGLASLVNVEGVKLILQHTTKHHKILLPNTNSGYGVGTKEQFCTEESELRPISLYGKLKVEAERLLLESGRGISFRLATVFGLSSRMRLDLLVNDFTYRAYHDRSIVLFEETFKRNFIHIRDVAEAFLFGIRHFEKMEGQAYNVGLSKANLSKRELCEKIKEYLPQLYVHAAPIGKDPDQRDYIVSNAKLEKLGWQPQKTLDDGIRELISAFQVIKYNQFVNY